MTLNEAIIDVCGVLDPVLEHADKLLSKQASIEATVDRVGPSLAEEMAKLGLIGETEKSAMVGALRDHDKALQIMQRFVTAYAEKKAAADAAPKSASIGRGVGSSGNTSTNRNTPIGATYNPDAESSRRFEQMMGLGD